MPNSTIGSGGHLVKCIVCGDFLSEFCDCIDGDHYHDLTCDGCDAFLHDISYDRAATELFVRCDCDECVAREPEELPGWCDECQEFHE